MGEERVARLREVVADACWQTLPEGQRGAFVLRAIVETLGIGDEAEHGVVIAADALEMLAGRKQTALAIRQRELVGESRKAARALRTLLAAAHGEEE